MIRANDRILFQGDSITDCGRARENVPVNSGLGGGYVNAIAARLLATRPTVRLVLGESFVLNCGVVTKDWVAEMDERRVVVRKLAVEFKAVFVPFQDMFNEAVKEAPATYWASDGVHPTIAGHYRMAQAWLAATGGR